MEAPQPIATRPTTVGDYTLGTLLGRGGMSEVYACAHPVHGDHLALKLLRDDADGAFHVEAKARDVEHSHVVRVIDAGLDPSTHRYYIVMERLDGPDLATHLARGPLDERAARTLFAQVADGMHAVHAHNIVHRDLKPANVMLHAGTPRIVDFGIAKILGDNAALVTSRRIGTLGYMAPEQLVGGKIAPSVDVWALGIMLFEAVAGRLPFGGFSESYTPQLVEPAPHVRSIVQVSPAYDALVAACLEPDPAKRPPMVYIARALRGEVAVASEAEERVTQDIGAMPAAPSPSVSSASSFSPSSASSFSPSSASPLSLAPTNARSRPLAWGIGAVLAISAIALAVFLTRTPDVAATANRESPPSIDRVTEPAPAAVTEPVRAPYPAPATSSPPPAPAARVADPPASKPTHRGKKRSKAHRRETLD